MGALQVVLLSAVAFAGDPDNVLLDFSATWCGPCQQMSPIVSRLEREGYPIRKVDVDQERDLARRFHISTIPAFVLVVDGQEATRVLGKTSEQDLKRMMMRITQRVPPAKPQDPAIYLASQRTGGRNPLAAPPPKQRSLNRTPQEPEASLGEPSVLPSPVAKTNAKNTKQLAIERTVAEQGVGGNIRSRNNPAIIARGNIGENDPEPSLDARYLDPSVRIRIKDSKGLNLGSGTVIFSEPGTSIILTCGHIFRNLEDNSVIEVDLFVDNVKSETLVGQPIKYDQKSDLGLILLPTTEPVVAARVAPGQFTLQEKMRVVTVGCGGGEDPTVQRQSITALNRYVGPANVECTGVPVQGRSGGGLFAESGEVIGVCTAADPRDSRGLYAGLKAVQELLDQCQLSHLYGGAASIEEEPAEETTELPALTLAANEEVEVGEPALESAKPAKLPPNAKRRAAATEAVDGATDAEIVCVIRPIGQPQAASKVVVINRASKDFVSLLTDELEAQPQYNQTSLQVEQDSGELEGAEVRVVKNRTSQAPETPQPYRRARSRR